MRRSGLPTPGRGFKERCRFNPEVIDGLLIFDCALVCASTPREAGPLFQPVDERTLTPAQPSQLAVSGAFSLARARMKAAKHVYAGQLGGRPFGWRIPPHRTPQAGIGKERVQKL